MSILAVFRGVEPLSVLSVVNFVYPEKSDTPFYDAEA